MMEFEIAEDAIADVQYLSEKNKKKFGWTNVSHQTWAPRGLYIAGAIV